MSRRRHARGDRRVAHAGAVQVQDHLVAVAELAQRGDLVERVHHAAAVVVRVLDGHQGSARVVHVVVDVEVVLEELEVERAVGRIEGARLQAREHRRAALLVLDDVGLGVQEDLVAGRGLGVQRDLVAHGARRYVEPGLFAEELGGVVLQGDDGRVVAQHVVADRGFGHGAPHLGRRARDGVAAQVDRPCVVSHRFSPPPWSPAARPTSHDMSPRPAAAPRVRSRWRTRWPAGRRSAARGGPSASASSSWRSGR